MATITVTSNLDATADDGVTTLREAVDQANANAGADTIVFDPSLFAQDTTIRLTQGAISISDVIEIDGASAAGWITVTGDRNGDDQLVAGSDITDIRLTDAAQLDDNSRVFVVTSGYDNGVQLGSTATVIAALTITGGNAQDGSGGGIFSATYAARSGLIVEDSIVSGNIASGRGGGIDATYLNVRNSVISGNSTTGYNGGGGGVNAGNLLITGSQISDNTTLGDRSFGGGAHGYFVRIANSTITGNVTYGDASGGGGASGSTITVSSSTVTGNATRGERSYGGGLALTNSTLDRSIVLGNYSAQTAFNDVAVGYIVYANHSIVGAGDTGFVRTGILGQPYREDIDVGLLVAAPEDVFHEIEPNGPVLSGALSNEGGLTSIVALREDPSNPALDAAPAMPGDVEDQTGNLRIVDLPGADNGGVRDLGSVELQDLIGEGVVTPLNQTGADGADILIGTNLANVLSGLRGGDFLAGRDGDDTLNGDRGADRLVGNEGDDRLSGGRGRDVLEGRQGDDTLIGGALSDQLIGGRGDDRILGNRGADQLEAGLGDDFLRGCKGRDQLLGQEGADRLLGASGRDMLFGGEGDDFLSGGGGADSLSGGIGNDMLEGGRGRDVFVFLENQQTGQIVDFTKGVDRIEFQGQEIGFDDLQFTQDGSVAVVTLNGTEVRPSSFDISDLEQSDFIF